MVATCLITAQIATAQSPDDISALIKHVPDGKDILIHSTVDIPSPLREALKSSPGCQLADHALRALPIITFQPAPNYRWMTLVPCETIVLDSFAFLYERDLTNVPTLMKFPIVASSVELTPRPGLLTWNAKTKELIGYRFTDMISTHGFLVARHIYRHLGGDELNGFAFLRSERPEQARDGGKNWQGTWEAQPGAVSPR